MLCYAWWFFYKYMSYAFSFMNIFYCILCQGLQILAFLLVLIKIFRRVRVNMYVAYLIYLKTRLFLQEKYYLQDAQMILIFYPTSFPLLPLR